MANFDCTIEKVAKTAKNAIMMMHKYKVPLIPENYLTWFEYCKGENLDLCRDIDGIIVKSGKIDVKFSIEIYRKYFDNPRGHKEFLQETTRILKQLFNTLMLTDSVAKDFRASLKSSSEKLENAKDIKEIGSIANEMISKTGAMLVSSVKLKEQLEETNNIALNLKKRLHKAEREAIIDPLTGLFNRKALDRRLNDAYEGFMKTGSQFSIIMFDVDHFRNFNNKYGHLIGDEVLKLIGETMRTFLKGGDFSARYGGEEFLAILPETSLENAVKVAEKLRITLSGKRLKIAKTGQRIEKITISCGVAEINLKDTIKSIVERADMALYLAKNSGRDNVKTQNCLDPSAETSYLSKNVSL